MHADALIAQLARTPRALEAIVSGLPPDEARHRPSEGSWSVLEIIAHLLDEEREDFRPRLDLLLRQPGTLGPPIDPQGWVLSRRYNERDLEETLRDFLAERERSLQWLHSLESPRWENELSHPLLGTLRAGDILASWAAHDLLHLRQVTHRLWSRVNDLGRPFETGYAGAW